MNANQSCSTGNPVYIILGASGGIGLDVCKRLAGKSRLVLAGRDEASVSLACDSFDARYEVGDLTNFDEIDRIVNATLTELGRIDGIVNLVGSILLKPAHRTSQQEFDQVILTNLASAFACVRSGAKAMLQTGGSIILMSSAAAQCGMINHEAVAAAKAGVIGLTRSAAATYARYNIRVNCIAPGLVETPLTKSITNNENARQASIAMHPLGRLGQPSDIASFIEYLLSPDAAWMTGQIVTIDGGLSSLKSVPTTTLATKSQNSSVVVDQATCSSSMTI